MFKQLKTVCSVVSNIPYTCHDFYMDFTCISGLCHVHWAEYYVLSSGKVSRKQIFKGKRFANYSPLHMWICSCDIECRDISCESNYVDMISLLMV